MKCVFLLSLFVVFVTGAPRDVSERIVDGTLVTEGEFPFIATVQLERKHLCAGFIYSGNWILTTASCLVGVDKSKIEVVVGTTSLTAPGTEQQIISVLDLVPYPDYDATLQLHNIALIKLSRAIVFGTTVNSVFYYDVDAAINTAVTVGWGATWDAGIESTKLYKTTLTVPANCAIYGSPAYDDSNMICAGSDTSSPCQNDVGSPLVQNGFVIGLMSKNKGCAAPYVPSVYTRLSAYRTWLDQTAGQQPGAPTTLSTTPFTIPTAPCIDCETTLDSKTTTIQSTTIKPTIPTAPCIDCVTTTTAKPTIPTAPCFGCADDIKKKPFIIKF